MMTLIIVASFFVVAVLLLWCVRMLRSGTLKASERRDELSLEASLPLGPQKRLLSVRWKNMDLLIAESGATVELLSSTILQSAMHSRTVSHTATPKETSSGVPTTKTEGVPPDREPAHDGSSAQGVNRIAHPDGSIRFGDLLESPGHDSRTATEEVFHA